MSTIVMLLTMWQIIQSEYRLIILIVSISSQIFVDLVVLWLSFQNFSIVMVDEKSNGTQLKTAKSGISRIFG